MKKTVEVPDIELTSKHHPRDCVEITVRKKYVVFNVNIDDTGNVFKVNKDELMRALR